MKLIPLTQGLFSKVDDADYDWLNQWKWYAVRDRRSVYAKRESMGKGILMHRVILETPEGMQGDHINGNGLDNQRGNLRNCTPTENRRNRIKSIKNGVKYKGVHPHYGKFRALIRVDGKMLHLGNFSTQDEAALAYNNGAIKYYGEFANLNKFKDSP